jgi:hypothetical protein
MLYSKHTITKGETSHRLLKCLTVGLWAQKLDRTQRVELAVCVTGQMLGVRGRKKERKKEKKITFMYLLVQDDINC